MPATRRSVLPSEPPAAAGGVGRHPPEALSTSSARSGPRPPKPPKARHAAECERLEQLPNVGKAVAADLRRLGIGHPAELATRDPLALYRALCEATGARQDPCVLDTFIAVVDFMRGAPPRPWWSYTAERKRRHGAI